MIAPARVLPSSRRAERVIRATRALVHGTIVLLALARGARAQGASGTTVTPAAADLDLVYSASRYAQEAREAPASVTIVTAQEIREFGYRTLADVLGAVRGFSTRYDLNYDYVTVRGLARLGDFNTRILVLVDGQRTNAAVSDVSNIGTDGLIDLAWVHHIEIIRGPGSAQFGANAFFAVINIVTGRSHGDSGGGRAEAQVGSFGSYAGKLAWGTRAGGSSEFMIAGSAERRGGTDRYYPEFDTPATNNGVAQGLDGEESWRLLSKGRSGDWSFEGAYAFRRRSVPTASYATDFNVMLQTYDREGIANVSYSHSFTDLSRLTVTGAFNQVWYNGDYPYGPTTLTDEQRGNIWSLDAQYLRVVGPGHKITVGSELRWVSDGQQSVVDVTPNAPDVVVFTDIRSQLVGAMFAQVEWRLGEHALLTTGVRHDEYQGIGGTTNPRVALVLRPTDQTTVKALYGTAFRPPNDYELYYQDGITQKAPVSLTPEHVHTAELEINQRVGGLTATVSAYSVATSDLINLKTDPADSLLVFANEGSPTTRGVELELRGRVGPFTGRASYAWQDAQEGDGTQPVDSPGELARVGIATPLLGDRASVALEVRHTGARPTLNGTDAPAYTAVNLTLLAHPLNRHMELMLGVKDLFNAGHVDPGGVEHVQNVLAQDGRTLRIGFRRSF